MTPFITLGLFGLAVWWFVRQFQGERGLKWERRWAVLGFLARYLAMDARSAWRWRHAKKRDQQVFIEHLDGAIEWMEAEWRRPEDKE